MFNLVKAVFIAFFVTSVVGCKSTPDIPEWYLEVEPVNADFYYSVGRGRTLNQAKKVALNQIGEQLWTQVKSENKLREVVRNNNGTETYQNLLDFNINSKSAQVTFTGAEYLESEQTDNSLFYVKARIKKSAVKQQIQRELVGLEETADTAVNALQYEDHLLWWLKNRDASQLKEDALIKISMLSVVDPNAKFAIKDIDNLILNVGQVHSQLSIYVAPTKKEPRIRQFVREVLAKEGLKTVSGRSKATHSINTSTDYRRSKVGGAYITTLVSDFSLSNQKRQNLATAEVISTGNSVTSYAMSSEGAARHFKQQLEEKGIWQTLGVK